MIYIIHEKCLFVLIILSQMLIINAANAEQDSDANILIDTQYAFGEFNLTWRIANFSQIFDTVSADFSLKNSSTKWRLILHSQKLIYLQRIDTGKPVHVDLKFKLTTSYLLMHGKKFRKFENIEYSTFELLDFEEFKVDQFISRYDEKRHSRDEIPIEFGDDDFIFFCTMKIFGPPVTKIKPSSAFLKPTSEKSTDDLSEKAKKQKFK